MGSWMGSWIRKVLIVAAVTALAGCGVGAGRLESGEARPANDRDKRQALDRLMRDAQEALSLPELSGEVEGDD